VEFHQGLPSKEAMAEWTNALVILDDVMIDACNSPEILSLYCVESHHHQITTAVLAQSIFPPGKCSRTISLNSHHIILFASKRDKLQVQALGRQMFPGETRFFMDSFRDATSKRYGYLVCDVHPASDIRFQLRTHIFPGEVTWVYQRV
jgi:hypothetical protein